MASDTASRLLQEIQVYAGSNYISSAKIRFPYGFIHSVPYHSGMLSFLNDESLRKNVSYGLILADLYRWLLVRTHLKGTAKEMIIKAAIFLYGAICESIIIDQVGSHKGKNRSYYDRTRWLHSTGAIDPATKIELDWLWEERNKMHLFLCTEPEYGIYKTSDYNRATKAFYSLATALSKAREKKDD